MARERHRSTFLGFYVQFGNASGCENKKHLDKIFLTSLAREKGRPAWFARREKERCRQNDTVSANGNTQRSWNLWLGFKPTGKLPLSLKSA